VDLPAVTRRCGLAESTYSASLPRVSGGVEPDGNYQKGTDSSQAGPCRGSEGIAQALMRNFEFSS